MLFVMNCIGVGGSELKVIKIANALAKSGVRVELAYLNPPDTSLAKVDSVVRVTNLQRRGPYSIRSLRQLCELVSRERQLVVSVNLYPLLYVVPVVKLSGSTGVRSVALVNSSVTMTENLSFESVYARLLKRCNRVVFGCNAQQKTWVEKHKLPGQQSEVIYNGVDNEVYSPTSMLGEGVLLRQRLGIPEDAIVIGSAGRLDPEKSFDLVITALARLNATGRETFAVFAGRGTERSRLEEHARVSGLADKIHFLGLENDVRPVLTIMDVFVLPSSAVETFSNAALEAMAMARAVVLSDIGGAAEMVKHGTSGMIFPVGDIDGLTDILGQLHDSRVLRESLGSAARTRCIGSFDFQNMVERYRMLLTP